MRQLLFFQLYLQAGNAFLQLRALAADVLQLLAGLLFVALIALAALLGVLDLLFQTGRLFAQGGALFVQSAQALLRHLLVYLYLVMGIAQHMRFGFGLFQLRLQGLLCGSGLV